MASFTIQFEDLMDQQPIEGAAVKTTLEIARFKPSSGEQSGSGELLKPFPFGDLVAKASETHDTQTTNQDGWLTLNFSPQPFEEIGSPQIQDDVVVFLVVEHFDLLGMHFGPRARRVDLKNFEDHLSLKWPCDLGSSIVGHTTPTSTRLWFQLASEPQSEHEFFCELLADASKADSTPVQKPVDFESRALTDVVDCNQLQPDTPYHYRLWLRHLPTEKQVTLASGELKTPAADASHLSFAFGSCHRPTVSLRNPALAIDALNRWEELAERRDHELLLLIGDQIYGDDIEQKWPSDDWFTRYQKRYRQLWSYPPMRDALRHTPTYMIFDDHEVKDDFGTKFQQQANAQGDDQDDEDDQIRFALDAYQLFQHAHNPGSQEGPPWHYHFRQGPASFFVMDGRTQRGQDKDFPVFGREQWQAIAQWAAAEETRDADIIVFVSPVPLALLPTETVLAIAEEATEEVGEASGALLGTGIGAKIGSAFGPLGTALGAGIGAAIGAGVGHEAGEELFEDHVEDSLLYDTDLAERWDLAENQPDLVRLLDLLFDLGNGVGDDRPRAVFVLSGDIHTGTMHVLRSLAQARHQRNPVILQLTSSAISHTPVNSELYRTAVSRIDEDVELDLKDVNALTLWETWENGELDQLPNEVLDVDDVFDSGAAAYALDSQGDRHYWTQFAGLLMQRTFGHIDLERVGPGRRYRFHCRIEGEDRNLDQRFEMDLDSDGPDIPRIPLPIDDAEFVQVNIPPTLEPNQEQRVSITVRNTGVTSWTADDYELQAVGTSPWRIDQVRLPRRTEPGEQVTFRFTLKAPHRSGDFDFRWQMGRRFGHPFGTVSRRRTIEVKRPESTDDNPSAECDDIAKELEAERQTLRGLQALLTDVNASENPGPISPPSGTGGGFGGRPRGGIQGGGPRGGIGGGPTGDQKAKIIQEIKQQKAIIRGLVARQRRLGCI